MFQHDEHHTAGQSGRGSIVPADGPQLRWSFPVLPARGPGDMRWASGFPLGDLDGDGSLEIVVTSPDYAAGLTPRVIVLKDTPGQEPPVRELWTYLVPGGESAGVDQYSAALADADGDGVLDVLFSARDGLLRALRGRDGELIWQFDTGRVMEAGPMVADLDGDGSLEVIQATDCALPDCASGGAIFVLPVLARGNNQPLWSIELPWKADSGEPAIADLDPNDGADRQAIVFGSWGGILTVAWQDPSGRVVRNDFDLRRLDDSIPLDSDKVVVRTSPLIVDWGDGPTAVLGWMPDHDVGTDARLSAIGLRADFSLGTVTFRPRWTAVQDTWKSSPALIPLTDAPPLVVAGTGIGTRFGTSFACEEIIGGVVARNEAGTIAWEVDLRPDGNVRGSSAVADVDGDGQPEVLVPVGCGGDLAAYDGASGAEEWRFALGSFTFASPSVGDLDGDGALEIVIASFDGRVYALGGS
jgi:outer membrane protein assembly factor BamB